MFGKYRLKPFMSRQFFTGNTLDRYPETKSRQSFKRSRAETLLAERTESSKTIVLDTLKFLQLKEGGIAYLSNTDFPHTDLDPKLTQSVFLGFDDQKKTAYWAVDVTNSHILKTKCLQYGDFVEGRPNAFKLPEFDAAVLAQALSMIDWNTRYFNCPSCKSITESAMAGHKRSCLNKECVSHSTIQNYAYPRTDAVVISCVVSPDGQKILLGRQKRWPKTLYSCIGKSFYTILFYE